MQQHTLDKAFVVLWPSGHTTVAWSRVQMLGIRLGNILLPLFCLGMVSSGSGHFSVVNLLCYCHRIHIRGILND